MKANEVRKMSAAELENKLKDLKKDLFNLRLQHATNQLDNPIRIAQVKKDIARVKTIIREQHACDCGDVFSAGGHKRDSGIFSRNGRPQGDAHQQFYQHGSAGGGSRSAGIFHEAWNCGTAGCLPDRMAGNAGGGDTTAFPPERVSGRRLLFPALQRKMIMIEYP